MTFAIRLRQLMDSQGLSRYKLAQKVGIDRSTIGRYLDGTTEKPTKENLHQLATYFNVSISELSGEVTPGSVEPNDPNEMIDRLELQQVKTQLQILNELVLSMKEEIRQLKGEAEKKSAAG